MSVLKWEGVGRRPRGRVSPAQSPEEIAEPDSCPPQVGVQCGRQGSSSPLPPKLLPKLQTPISPLLVHSSWPQRGLFAPRADPIPPLLTGLRRLPSTFQTPQVSVAAQAFGNTQLSSPQTTSPCLPGLSTIPDCSSRRFPSVSPSQTPAPSRTLPSPSLPTAQALSLQPHVCPLCPSASSSSTQTIATAPRAPILPHGTPESF